MPEDLKVSQIGSSPLPPPFRGLHSPRVRKHCQIIFACYFRKSSIEEERVIMRHFRPVVLYALFLHMPFKKKKKKKNIGEIQTHKRFRITLSCVWILFLER